MADVNISKFRAQVVREGSKPAAPGFVVSEGQNPVDPAGSGQNHLPVTIGTPANGLAVTEAQVLTIDKAQIFAGTSSQFVKGDGTLDSTAYGTGSVTSVGLTMPSAFNVANSPVTTAGTLAVTGAGTTAQYIRGDGSLATFPALTGFVPYTGATADVNLGTHDLAAERGTFANNGSSDTLTVNHTSGSGYGIIVTKGGSNEALYVSKTSGSGNAMTVVGGRTSLVDLALSSVTNTAGDFLTLSGGVVHKRTAAQTLTDIGGQAALTNPVTGTGTTNFLPKFTGASTIGNSAITDDGTTVTLISRSLSGTSAAFSNTDSGSSSIASVSLVSDVAVGDIIVSSSTNTGSSIGGRASAFILRTNSASTGGLAFLARNANGIISFHTGGNTERARITSGGNLLVGTTTDAGFKLDVNGTGRFSGNIGVGTAPTSTYTLSIANTNANNELQFIGSEFTNIYSQTTSGIQFGITSSGNSAGIDFLTNNSIKLSITSGGNVGLGVTPSAWASGFTAMQVRNASFWSTGNDASITANAYYDGSNYRFIGNAGASRVYHNTDGSIGWSQVASGTAGNVVSLTQAMTLTSGGNLLVGTTTDAGFRLDVNGTGRFIASGSTNLVVQRTGSNGVFMQLLDASGNSVFLGGNNGDFQVQTPSGGFSNKLVVTNAGNVGIGTTSPAWMLEINKDTSSGSTGQYPSISVNNPNGSGYGAYWFYQGTTFKGGMEYFNGTNNLSFYANSATRMTITSGGNVLIGTTTDSGSKLNVNGRIQGQEFFSVGSLNDTDGSFLIDHPGVQTWKIGITNNNSSTFSIGNDNGGSFAAKYFNITNSGNVGIGTTSPSQLLHLKTELATGSGVGTAILIESGGSGGDQGWIGVNKGSGNGLEISVENRDIIFNTGATTPFGGSERMRITSGGNVLIGTTTDVGAKLYVNGGIRTANPTGSTSNDWLLGRALTSGTSSPDRWIRVQIGNLYYDILAVYMGSV